MDSQRILFLAELKFHQEIVEDEGTGTGSFRLIAFCANLFKKARPNLKVQHSIS
jgi:hypothetical protein